MKNKSQNKKSFPIFSCFVVMTFMALLCTSSLVNANGNGNKMQFEQIIKEKVVTLNFSNAGIRKILEEIKKQSGIGFALNNSKIESNLNALSINVTKMSVEDALELLLKGSNYTYVIVENNILIEERKTQTEKNVWIEGNVSDKATKLPISGATVIVEQTSNGSITDGAGNFKVSNIAIGSTIEIACMGYKPLKKVITMGGDFRFELEASTMEVEDVVITGIFNKAKESYTGATKFITNKELRQFGNQNILKTIRNIDPSFRIDENINQGSNPNNTQLNVQMRGNSALPQGTNLKETVSTYNTNMPLIILDGFEVDVTRLNDLDQNRVDNITILKDASATAIYGSRGANGVLVVTTKRPAKGKLTVSYLGDISLEMPDLSDYSLLNAREKLQLEVNAGIYNAEDVGAKFQGYQDLYNARLANVEKGIDTYWLSQPLRTGVGTKHSINIEGGDDAVRYGISLGVNDINGVMKGSKRTTYNGGVYVAYTHKNFTFRNDLQISLNNSSDTPYGSFRKFAEADPYYAPKDANGEYQMRLENVGSDILGDKISAFKYNPLYDGSIGTKYTNKYSYLSNFFAVDYTILEGLTARARLGLIRQIGRSDSYMPGNHTDFIDYTTEELLLRRGSYTLNNTETNSVQADVTITYNKTFNEKHNLTVGLNGSLTQAKDEYNQTAAEGYFDAAMDYISMGNSYVKDGKPRGMTDVTRSVGLVANASYTFDNRLFLDVSGRLDGSSRFGANSRIAPFWSVGAGWLLHNESFLKGNEVLNYLKLRVSYGTTGSQNFSPYQALTTYSYSQNGVYRNLLPVSILALGNEDLSWQQTNQYNIGLETKFFNNRIGLNIDAYYKLTNDLLADMTLPPSNGFTSYKENVGKIENKGLELGLNGYIFNNKDFSWLVTGTVIYNKDKIKKISDALRTTNDKTLNNDGRNPSFLFREGESTNTIYVVKSLGIDPSNGKEIFVKQDGSLSYEWDIKDKVAAGSASPKVWGNISTSVRYKNLTLSAVLGYRIGASMYNYTLIEKVENVDPWFTNTDSRVLTERWTKKGDVKFFKDVKDKTITNASSRFVQKESLLDLQSVSLSYDLSNDFIKNNLKMQNIRFTAYMENAFRFSTIKQERGLDYPFARNASLSVSIVF